MRFRFLVGPCRVLDPGAREGVTQLDDGPPRLLRRRVLGLSPRHDASATVPGLHQSPANPTGTAPDQLEPHRVHDTCSSLTTPGAASPAEPRRPPELPDRWIWRASAESRLRRAMNACAAGSLMEIGRAHV